MQTIYKYQLGEDTTIIHTPKRIEPLCVMLQNGWPYLWAKIEVDSSETLVPRTIYCVGTGNRVPPGTVYLGTVQMGVYVWHFFMEVVRTPQKEKIGD